MAEITLDDERVVGRRLGAAEQCVERGDVDADAVAPERRGLDQRRATAGERVEDRVARLEVATKEDLDQLRDVLPEVRMEPVNVLRPLPLGKIALRPREFRVQLCGSEPLIDLRLTWHALVDRTGAERTEADPV